MDGLISLIILAVVIGLVLMLAVWVIRTLGVPEPFGKIAVVLIVVLGAVIFLQRALPLVGVSI
jgi:hypothetical protein